MKKAYEIMNFIKVSIVLSIMLCPVFALRTEFIPNQSTEESHAYFSDPVYSQSSHQLPDCPDCSYEIGPQSHDTNGKIDSTALMREAFDSLVETMLDDKATISHGIDTAVSPCEDHFLFVNGGWRNKVTIPKSRAYDLQMMTFFRYAEVKVTKRMQELLDSARKVHSTTLNPTIRVLGVFYESCMTVDTLEYFVMKKARRAKGKVDSTRSQECLSRTMQHLGGAAGQAFIEDLKKSGAVDRMAVLLSAIKDAAIERLKGNTLMSADERTNAIERLDRLVLRVGIPDRSVDYNSLQLSSSDYWKNKVTIANFGHSKSIVAIGKNLREQWKMSLLRVNASYWPGDHAIEVPPIMFYPPFFFREGEDLLNFAAVGLIIGHEIFHSIAQQLPTIQNTVMKGEIERFKAFNTDIGELDGWRTSGKGTFSEDVADLGGSRIAYQAWKKTVKKDKKYSDGTVDGFTPDQRFFIAMGRVWRSKWTPAGVAGDVHAPGFARANGIAMQNPEFRKAFGCKPGDRMYLSDEQLSKIW